MINLNPIKDLVHMKCVHYICFIIVLILSTTLLSIAQMPVILAEKQRAEIVDKILEERLDTLLPELMRKHDVKMWIVISREYNEDPLLKTMLPSTWLSARRRTILLFYDEGEGKDIEKIAKCIINQKDMNKSKQLYWILRSHRRMMLLCLSV